MTGGEIVPVGAAAVKAAEKALKADAAQQAQLQDLANNSAEMEVAAKQYAKRIAIKQTILLKLYQPLASWLGVSKSYFDMEFADDMAERISQIPDENLSSPPPSVAIPAMQGLSFSLGEPDLKDLYLNLLATASDDRHQSKAHPSFAEIIKQLNAREARELKHLLAVDSLPVMRVGRQTTGEEGVQTMFPLCVDYVDEATGNREFVSELELWIQNWVRLGLIEVDFMRYLTAPGAYDWLDNRPEIIRARQLLPDDQVITSDKGLIRRTKFGEAFAAAVGATP